MMLVLRRRERSRCNESWISFNVCLRWGRCFVDTQSCFWFLVGHIREIVSFYLSFFLLPQHQDLQDGSMLTDFLGREECRTFVLGDQVRYPSVFLSPDNLKHSILSSCENMRHQGGGGSVDLFGSASIEGWLQLQLSNKVIQLPTHGPDESNMAICLPNRISIPCV